MVMVEIYRANSINNFGETTIDVFELHNWVYFPLNVCCICFSPHT